MNCSIPNFFIIGGPKCGTTALSAYLKENPQVFFCEPKEPHYFNDDYLDRGVITEADYLRLFEGRKEQHRAIGEGSVQYLRSESAVKNILKFNPEAKFILMLRNPVEVAYSYHSQAVISHGENVTDFRKAWNLRGERRVGKKLPHRKKERKVFVYSDIAKFGEQLDRLFSCVNKSNVKIIFFEDFKNNTLATYKDTLQFLGVDYDGKIDFPVINQSKKYRFMLFERFRNNIVYFKEKYNIQIKTGLLSYFRRRNVKVIPRKKLSIEFENELKEYFLSDILKIEAMTGRDLSHWKKNIN